MIGYFSLTLLIFSIAFFVLFFYSLTKQRNSLSGPFSVMCLAAGIYIFGYSFELRAQSLNEILFFIKLQYFGIPFMSAFWLLLSYKFLFKKTASIQVFIIVLVIPFLTLFMCVTNDFHHLLYTNVSTVAHDGYLLSVLDKGPWYLINISYAYIIQLFAVWVFFNAWQNRGCQKNVQAFWMFLGSFWPALVNLIYVTGISPLNLDLTPFGLGLTAVFFYIAIFKYGFLHLQEIVKDVTFLEINEGIIVIDQNNRLIDFNIASRKIFTWLNTNAIGIYLAEFPEGKEIIEQTGELFEITLNRQDQQKYYEFRKTCLKDNGKNFGFVYFIRDISEQKEMLNTLNNIASFDSLTQIYNRRKLLEETEKELLRSKRYGHCVSFLMIDIDHFKLVNDNLGHQTGDEVLKVIAKICKDRIRRTDILGRYGGEEFLIVLAETDETHAFATAEDIRRQIADSTIVVKENSVKLTVSIGIVTACGDEASINVERLIDFADNALYNAKENGRNQSCVHIN